jgi:hypothetical protein
MLKKLFVAVFVTALVGSSTACVVKSSSPGARNRARCGNNAHWDPGKRACVLNGSGGKIITSH